LAKLEMGNPQNPSIAPERLDAFLQSHLIDPGLLRSNRFEEFMADRQKRLLALIETATGKAAYSGPDEEEGQDVEDDDDTVEAGFTLAEA
jgi:hypothetical protein